LRDEGVSLLARWKHLVTDPPPEYAFEITEGGIAWTLLAQPASIRFAPLEPGTLAVSPLRDNVTDSLAFARAVDRIAAQDGLKRRKGRPRRAALLVPDYAARVAVLDFDTFPADPAEQAALARFRVRKAVPFDIDSAVVACYPQPRPGEKKIDVAIAVMNLEVAAHYEAPFKAAGFHCGFVSISALAALALSPDPAQAAANPRVVAKLSGRVLAISLIDGGRLRLYRCIELDHASQEEIFGVLAPTFAYAEDELRTRPQALDLCGFPAASGRDLEEWARELGLAVAPLRSRYAPVTAAQAGLLGYLERSGGR
jgi:type IV pilus assembly protein PilM